MKNKYLILILLWFSNLPCFSQIFATGNGDGTATNCFTWEPQIALSATLLTFDAACSNNKTTILWSTSSAFSNDHFTIERSTDGMSFQLVGDIQVRENSNQTQHFSFIDKNALPVKSYYRLKQTRTNGQSDYSRLVTVNCRGGNAASVSVYPNPTTGMVNIISDQSSTSLVVRNLLGQPVLYCKTRPVKTTIDLSHLPGGIYYIEMQAPGGTTYHKIVLERN